MNPCIIVIGTGGDLKKPYLHELIKYYDLVVIDCQSSRPTTYPDNAIVFYVDCINRENLKKLQPSLLSKNPKFVTTIFEPCIEAVGWVREQLHIEGPGSDDLKIFRNKIEMYKYLSEQAVRVAEWEEVNFQDLLSNKLYKPSEYYIVKPSLGFGNIGVRKIDASIEALKEVIPAIENDCISNPFADCTFNEISSQWLICSYIPGKEIEVDIIVIDGKVIFNAIAEKTIIHSYNDHCIEENNSMIPPLTLNQSEIDNAKIAIEQTAAAAYNHLSKRGVRFFCLYAEYRINHSGEVFCLEMALRIGGALIPAAVHLSKGVNLFEVAAACAVGKCPTITVEDKCSVYWQLLYSQYVGKFLAIEGEHLITDNVKFKCEKGALIQTPQSDPVAGVLFQGESPDKVARIAASKLSKIQVLIEDLDQKKHFCPVPFELQHLPA